MLIRTFAGLNFAVHSPSEYEFLTTGDSTIEGVKIVYDGEWWMLQCKMRKGHTITREFRSLDAAIELISSRREAS